MNLEQIFEYEGKFCRVVIKDGETVKGIIRLVSYQGEDIPDENFIMIGFYGIPFDDIDSIEEIDDPSEPDVLIDELQSVYKDQKRVNEIFDRLDTYLKEEHSEEEKQIIKDFYDKHVLSQDGL